MQLPIVALWLSLRRICFRKVATLILFCKLGTGYGVPLHYLSIPDSEKHGGSPSVLLDLSLLDERGQRQHEAGQVIGVGEGRTVQSQRTNGKAPETYLDNAATTMPYPEVVETVCEALRDNWGNPSSSHHKGREAKGILERSRATIASSIGVHPDEVYFTSGGTEANNLAIIGSCLAQRERHGQGMVVTSTLEHPSVTKTVRGLKREGWPVEYLGAVEGELDLARLSDLLDSASPIALLSIMSVQNELGYRFPLDEIAHLRDQKASDVLFHTDAVQAFGKFELLPREMGVDLMSMSSHKIGGPKGIGALYVRRDVDLFTTAFGGGQERGLRSGTEALPLIAGFAKAVEITMEARPQTFARVERLKHLLIDSLRQRFGQVVINSREDGSPFILNFSLPGTNNKKALERLSEAGVFISTASACASNHTTVQPGTWREKHPLSLQLAGVPMNLTQSTYRISFGKLTTEADIKRFVDVLDQVV